MLSNDRKSIFSGSLPSVRQCRRKSPSSRSVLGGRVISMMRYGLGGRAMKNPKGTGGQACPWVSDAA